MSFSHIWEIIVESNTLNFLILAVLLVFVMKKINLSKMISDLQKNIENKVNESLDAKKESEKALVAAEEKMSNIEPEIQEITESTNNTADIMSKKIISQAQEQINIVEKNAQNILQDNIRRIKNNLSDITAKTSVELLRKNVKENLEADKNLQQVFIEEAINELEGLSI